MEHIKTHGLIALGLTAGLVIAPVPALAQTAQQSTTPSASPSSESQPSDGRQTDERQQPDQSEPTTQDSPTQGQSLRGPSGEPRSRVPEDNTQRDQTVPEQAPERAGSVGEPNRAVGPRLERAPEDEPARQNDDNQENDNPWWRFWN